MYKTYKSFIAMAVITLLLAMCTTKDENGVYFASNIDLSNSVLSGDRTQTAFWFSVDNGVTFAAGQNINVGQKYQVRVVDSKLNAAFNPIYNVDWSGSNPKPSDATSQTPEFTMQNNNTIAVKVTGAPYCALIPSSWTGVWGGDEVGACCGGTDKNTLVQDSTNPNKFTMDNFWGDHVSAYIIFSPSTSTTDQVVTLPSQTTADPGLASGTGTYDQCKGTFTILTTYVAFGGTYVWQYNFHR